MRFTGLFAIALVVGTAGCGTSDTGHVRHGEPGVSARGMLPVGQATAADSSDSDDPGLPPNGEFIDLESLSGDGAREAAAGPIVVDDAVPATFSIVLSPVAVVDYLPSRSWSFEPGQDVYIHIVHTGLAPGAHSLTFKIIAPNGQVTPLAGAAYALISSTQLEGAVMMPEGVVVSAVLPLSDGQFQRPESSGGWGLQICFDDDPTPVASTWFELRIR